VDFLEIEAEPMLFGASTNYAMEHGGTLTRRFLLALGFDRRPGIIVDTRAHMLLPGHLPAIGGWHCDAVPRGADGQPDFGRLHEEVRHWTYTVASVDGLCHIEFAAEPVDLSIERSGGPLWSDVHWAMERRKPATVMAPHGSVVVFRRDSLHRATKADRPGWRFFARASESTAAPANKIRRQTQVYIESESASY
jgi:hypothetical protein